MNDFNVIPNTGKFGNIVNAINSNFQLAKEAIDVSSYQKTNCLGFYDTAAALNAAQPSPSDNDWALVGTNSNLTIYVAQNGSWTATSTTLSLAVDLTNYTLKSIYENGQAMQDQRIEDAEDNIDGLTQSITELEEAIESINMDIQVVSDDGFFYTDAIGNIAMKYTPNSGFDVAKLSDHFKSLLPVVDDNYTDFGEFIYDI